jgi:hypothetical protein
MSRQRVTARHIGRFAPADAWLTGHAAAAALRPAAAGQRPTVAAAAANGRSAC